VGIDLSIHVLIVKDDERVGPGRETLKIATSRGVRHLHDHESRFRAQHITQKAVLKRKRERYGCAVFARVLRPILQRSASER
jgi:hypothetical protein